MPLIPLISAGIESGLNRFLWKDSALKAARQRLYGKVLRVDIRELPAPVVLVFSEQHLDVLSQWEGEADCTVTTHLSALAELRDRQQLTGLIRRGSLEVQGSLPVVQNLVALVDLAECDPAELLAPYLGDIVAESVSTLFRSGAARLKKNAVRNTRYLSEAITEEWRLAPGGLEVAWFNDEVAALERAGEALSQRLEKLEGQ